MQRRTTKRKPPWHHAEAEEEDRGFWLNDEVITLAKPDQWGHCSGRVQVPLNPPVTLTTKVFHDIGANDCNRSGHCSSLQNGIINLTYRPSKALLWKKWTKCRIVFWFIFHHDILMPNCRLFNKTRVMVLSVSLSHCADFKLGIWGLEIFTNMWEVQKEVFEKPLCSWFFS